MQSMLPVFRGWNRCSSQPGMPSRPRMQSFVRHAVQTAGSRTFTSSGETSDCTKLNCPIGQTYLQKTPPRKKPSIAKAAAKYPKAIQPSSAGLSHSESLVSPEEKHEQCTASHLLRKPPRPVPARRQPSPGQTSRERERAGQAKHVSQREQAEIEQPSPMNPRQHAGQIHWRHLRPGQPIVDHRRGQNARDNCKASPRTAPSQESGRPAEHSTNQSGTSLVVPLLGSRREELDSPQDFLRRLTSSVGQRECQLPAALLVGCRRRRGWNPNHIRQPASSGASFVACRTTTAHRSNRVERETRPIRAPT